MGFPVPRLAALCVASLVLFIGCAGGPEPVSGPTAAEPVAKPRPMEVARPVVTGPMDKPKEAPAALPDGQGAATHAEITVSKEVYAKTFDELEALIKEWSAIIARKDYDKWLTCLSRAYVQERSAPEYLAELSRNQKLRDRGITLKSLKDYFLDVVVPARFDAGLDRIEFESQTKVKAYANIGGEPAILYYVVREGDTWKIGTSDE